MDNLKYTKLEMQSYFNSKTIFKIFAMNIFKFRTRMAQVKINFSSQFALNLKCPECESLCVDDQEISDDSQEHLLYHSKLHQETKFLQLSEGEVYSKLFVGDNEEKCIVMKLLEEVLVKRSDC